MLFRLWPVGMSPRCLQSPIPLLTAGDTQTNQQKRKMVNTFQPLSTRPDRVFVNPKRQTGLVNQVENQSHTGIHCIESAWHRPCKDQLR